MSDEQAIEARTERLRVELAEMKKRAERAEGEALRLYEESWAAAVAVAEVRALLEAESFSADVVRLAQEHANQQRVRAEQAACERDEALAESADLRRVLDAHHAKAAQLADDVLAEQAFRASAESEVARLLQQREEDAQTVRKVIDDRMEAEADNAALLDNIATFHEAWKSGRDTLALAALLRLAKGDHPGAALLEYVRALEKVREAVEPWRVAILKVSHPDDVDADDRALLDACAAADALKVKP